MARIRLNSVSKRLSGDLGRVQILLKEVLQQMPQHMAKQIMDAVENGGEARITLRENSRGRGYKCAFSVLALRGEARLDKQIKNAFPASGGKA
jgi:hypothetical protein